MTIQGLLEPPQIAFEAIRDISVAIPNPESISDMKMIAIQTPALISVVSQECARLYMIYSQLKLDLQKAEWKEEQLRAKVWLNTMDESETTGKKFTVDTIKAKVEDHSTVKEQKEEIAKIIANINQAKGDYDSWNGLKDALKIKYNAMELLGRFFSTGRLE